MASESRISLALLGKSPQKLMSGPDLLIEHFAMIDGKINYETKTNEDSCICLHNSGCNVDVIYGAKKV